MLRLAHRGLHVHVGRDTPCDCSACFKHKKPNELVIAQATPTCILPAVVHTCRCDCICVNKLSF